MKRSDEWIFANVINGSRALARCSQVQIITAKVFGSTDVVAR